MSNFYCDKCGMPILEDEHGDYFTGCSHYPLTELSKFNKKDRVTEITSFRIPEIPVARSSA